MRGSSASEETRNRTPSAASRENGEVTGTVQLVVALVSHRRLNGSVFSAAAKTRRLIDGGVRACDRLLPDEDEAAVVDCAANAFRSDFAYGSPREVKAECDVITTER